MAAEPLSFLQRLKLLTAGRASAGGGASSGVSRVQDVTCSLRRLPTSDAADVRQSGTGWARGGADGGVGGGAGRGASVCCGGGKHHTVSGCLILGEDAAD
ncbi:hypothetical protein NDU88_006171 [Pleurodeles waltl]|uniref:Uncharacterized protein n=1 Tax=Pleurodeles waltl TaxID=8319 RepID=A0AAV7TXJ8_PLEWA|nr:hypothetical protein NDU88_006171 [Pleurodeles waltl]